MKRTWMLLAIALLSVTGCRSTSADSDGTLFVSGRIDGDTVDISSKRPGRITDITVREGDSVHAGQLLAVISSPQDEANYEAQQARVRSGRRKLEQLQRQLKTYAEKIRQSQIYVEQAQTDAPAQVKTAEANVAASKAELARSEAELQQSKVDAERYAPLAKTGAVAAQLAEQYATKLKVAEASVDANRKQVAAAEADVDAGQGELRRIEADLTDLRILAPIAGTILTRSAEPGRVVASGQTILTMVDLTKLYLRGFVPEGNVGKVRVGQSAEVYLDSRPKEAIPAEVIRIDPQVMFTPENTYFKDDRVKQVMGVKLGLRGGGGFAKPGMPADGLISIGRP